MNITIPIKGIELSAGATASLVNEMYKFNRSALLADNNTSVQAAQDILNNVKYDVYYLIDDRAVSIMGNRLRVDKEYYLGEYYTGKDKHTGRPYTTLHRRYKILLDESGTITGFLLNSASITGREKFIRKLIDFFSGEKEYEGDEVVKNYTEYLANLLVSNNENNTGIEKLLIEEIKLTSGGDSTGGDKRRRAENAQRLLDEFRMVL